MTRADPYPATPPPCDGETSIRKTWIIIREPGFVPVKKDPIAYGVTEFLRECVKYYPEGTTYTICELTWDFDLWVQCGREYLAMAAHAEKRRRK